MRVMSPLVTPAKVLNNNRYNLVLCPVEFGFAAILQWPYVIHAGSYGIELK